MLFLSIFISWFHLCLWSNHKVKLVRITLVLHAFIDHLLCARHCDKPWKKDEKDLFFSELKGPTSPEAKLAEREDASGIVGSQKRVPHPGWVREAVGELMPTL